MGNRGTGEMAQSLRILAVLGTQIEQLIMTDREFSSLILGTCTDCSCPQDALAQWLRPVPRTHTVEGPNCCKSSSDLIFSTLPQLLKKQKGAAVKLSWLESLALKINLQSSRGAAGPCLQCPEAVVVTPLSSAVA